MPDQTLSNLSVLVVEDEYLLAEDMAEALTELGATVVGPLGDLDQALALAARTPDLDAAVLDISLGGQLVFPLADLLAQRAVRYIFTTGYGDEVVPEAHRNAPLCQKPVNTKDLSALLGRRG